MEVLLQGTRQSGITCEYFKHRLEEETEQYKQEIERLTKQNKALNEMYELTKKEYIRLNNIINEFEDILKRDIKACNNKFENMFDRNYRRLILEEKLEQLQELKGSESNE